MDEPSKLPGLEAMPPEDQKAIGATMSALLGGFSKRDAGMLEAVYSRRRRLGQRLRHRQDRAGGDRRLSPRAVRRRQL